MSVYYQHSGKIGLASRLSLHVRTQVFQRFMDVMQPIPTDKVLDIGVTSDTQYQESNFFEKLYPHKEQIVCVGTENGKDLEKMYPGLKFFQVLPGKKFPFVDNEFEIAFSNAVIEHVGSFAEQQAFVAEACRVARRVFISTPNRWFPIEHHTSIPLLHYLPKPLYRRIIRRTPFRYWSYEENLNILTISELRQCFPKEYSVKVDQFGLGWGVLSSNLVAYTESDEYRIDMKEE